MASGKTDPPLIRFYNCRVASSGTSEENNAKELWIRNGRVVDSQHIFYVEHRRPDINVDCKGALVAPGMVDMQVNGGWGIDFSSMDDPEQGLRIVARNLLRHGVTSFNPTLVSSTPNAYRQILPFLGPAKGSADAGAAVLGAHVEGPFISSTKIGCHDPANVCAPKDGLLSLIAMYGEDNIAKNISVVTLAPELPGALSAISCFSERGILVSVGHSTATIHEGEEAVRAGARCVTHLFNAMLPFHHRDPGLVGLLAMKTKLRGIECSSADEGIPIHFGIIADGIHAHPAALRVAHRMAPHSLCLVSDQVLATGLTDGRHDFPGLGRHIMVSGRRATLVERPETLCGAVTPLDECVRTFQKETACPIDYSLAAASRHPAAALKLLATGQCGSLGVGAVADLILVDQNDFSIKATYLSGECVYTANDN